MDVNGNDNAPEWGYCQIDGCHQPAIPCYISGGPPDDPDDLLCAEHCFGQGYCCGCGRLWAGNERFDFSELGMCGDCESACREDDADDDDEPAAWDFRYLLGPYSEFSDRGAT